MPKEEILVFFLTHPSVDGWSGECHIGLPYHTTTTKTISLQQCNNYKTQNTPEFKARVENKAEKSLIEHIALQL